MSLVLNHNMMAANTARNLNAHYGRLSTSTQRLSSGLRINSAADDAAGLAIRELQRADIAAFQQGARNANDAVSMIQVADGSLSVIDEKLIRMRELAEQAATGTYDSTQRLMIESEYQAMASEITRIANATDFNGIKLLDGTLAGEHDGSGLTSTGKMKVHFGTGNDSAEDYYYVEIGECTSEALGIGNASTWQDVQKRALQAFKTSLVSQIKNDSSLQSEDKSKMMAQVDENVTLLENALNFAADPATAFVNFTNDDEKFFPGNPSLREKYMTAVASAQKEFNAPGWPTTAEDILAKISASINNYPPETEFNCLSPNTFTDIYLPDVIKAAEEAGDMYGLTAGTLSKIIQDNTVIGTATKPAIPLQETNLADWRTDINQKIEAEAAVKTGIATAIKNAINDEVKKQVNNLPEPPVNDIYPDIYTKEYFTELKAKVESAASDAANKMGMHDTSKLHAVFADTKNDITGTGTGGLITKDDITKWITVTMPAAISGNTDLTTAATDAGLKYIEDKINSVKYELNVLDKAGIDKLMDGIKEYDAARGIPLGAALKDAEKCGMDLTNLRAALDNASTIYGTVEYLDAKGIAEYREALIKGINNDPAVLADATDAAALNKKVADKINEFWGGLRYTEQQKFNYAWGQAAINKLANKTSLGSYGLGYEKFTLGANLEDVTESHVDALLSNALKNMESRVGRMDFAGFTVETQEDAQTALEAINEAIVAKDKIRANLGSTQNRLENTISNINIMAENLQAAESRISDVDIATEMTQMVRNQILSQAATAMLAQANSLPQMAMQLIGG